MINRPSSLDNGIDELTPEPTVFFTTAPRHFVAKRAESKKINFKHSREFVGYMQGSIDFS